MEPSRQHLPLSVKYMYYVVMARYEMGGQELACGFGFLPNKQAETYQLMLSMLSQLLSVILNTLFGSLWLL